MTEYYPFTAWQFANENPILATLFLLIAAATIITPFGLLYAWAEGRRRR